MRPRAHLPVPRAPTSTRVTATAARLPISRVPRRILRKAMALSRVRLGRCLLTSTTGAETTAGGPRRASTRLATQPRRPRLPVTTKVTKRILRATRTTAGTLRRSMITSFSARFVVSHISKGCRARVETCGAACCNVCSSSSVNLSIGKLTLISETFDVYACFDVCEAFEDVAFLVLCQSPSTQSQRKYAFELAPSLSRIHRRLGPRRCFTETNCFEFCVHTS